MDEKFLRGFLKNKDELDWLDFKQKWKIYDSTNGNINTRERDELIKDVLGLANGNSNIVKKTKYLIIGADDKEFDENGMRVIHHVDYPVPSQSDITKWVNGACTPSVVGIESEIIPIAGKSIYVVTIPPTFDLHETTRELNAKGKFSKFTVFMRQNEHTVPASVQDGVTLQQLKLLFRQEISNPPAILLGAILGAAIAIIFWSAGYNATKLVSPIIGVVNKGIIAILGGALGAEAGWLFRKWNTVRYDWRYWSLQTKVRVVIVGILTVAIVLAFWNLIS